jgi:tetratricopeptide (TPR) repeat protein
MKTIFIASALVLLFVAPAGVWAQFGGPGMSTASMGHMETPEMKASAAFSRGLKLKKKAEGESDTTKRIKLLEKAKEELSKSLAYAPDFDAFLALGQVYLGMGKADSALDACSQAQALRPGDTPAKSCIEEARKKTDKPDTETKAGGGRQ